jgi:hypothetical protein
MQWIPIPSTGGNLKAFGIVLPKSKLRGSGKAAAGSPPVEDTRVSNQQISVALAVNLGLSPIFSGTVSSNEVGYWLDAMAYTDQYEAEPTQGNLVLATRFGFGIRVMFRVQVLNANAKLNYGAIGAAIDAQFASATYEIDAFGLGAGALPIILGSLKQFGNLTSDAFYSLNSAIIKNLIDYIKAHIGEFQPQRVAALLQSIGASDSLDVSQAILFAMREIRSGTSLRDALAKADDLDSASIRLVYSTMLGDVPDTTVPNKQQRDSADEWLADD